MRMFTGTKWLGTHIWSASTTCGEQNTQYIIQTVEYIHFLRRKSSTRAVNGKVF